jgi:two-component system invasion response regulator UvrY
MDNKRILIGDDHSIVRSGLKYLIKEMLPFSYCEEAGDGDEVVNYVKKTDYDLVIIDVNMPGTDSFTLVNNILAYKPNSKILVFSMNPEEIYARRFLKLGALGYLHKETNSNLEVVNAIHTVLSSKVYMSAHLKELIELKKSKDGMDNPFDALSDREIQIAKYLIGGKSNADIKNTLNIHSSTIGTHKIRLFDKLQIKSMVELVELAKLYPF